MRDTQARQHEGDAINVEEAISAVPLTADKRDGRRRFVETGGDEAGVLTLRANGFNLGIEKVEHNVADRKMTLEECFFKAETSCQPSSAVPTRLSIDLSQQLAFARRRQTRFESELHATDLFQIDTQGAPCRLLRQRHSDMSTLMRDTANLCGRPARNTLRRAWQKTFEPSELTNQITGTHIFAASHARTDAAGVDAFGSAQRRVNQSVVKNDASAQERDADVADGDRLNVRHAASKGTSMRLALSIIVAAAIGVATPAVAQAPQPNTAPATVPSAPPPKKLKKKKMPVVEDADSISETTKFEPELIYRAASLVPVKESVYHDPKHVDFVDQIYIILHLTRTYNYVHEVVIEPAFRTLRNNPASWDKDHVVEQAYVESAIKPWLSLTAGKKAEFEGSGFFVNPSDLLNENKDVFDPLYQKEGVVFGRLTVRSGDFSLGLGYIPERGVAAKKGRAWMKASGQVAEIDIKLQATSQESEKATVGLSAQRFFGGAFELHTDSRYQSRQRDQKDGNVGPMAYSAYSGIDVKDNKDDDASGYYLAGTRYVFSHQRTFIAEYIQNQSGLLPDDFLRYFDQLRQDTIETKRVIDPPTKILGRHYGFVGYQDDALIKGVHLSINALQNTDDNSNFVAMIARYHLSPITSIELAPTIFKGGKNTEFGEMPFASATYLVFKGRF